MNSINPLQTPRQDPYSQTSANFQNTRTGLTDPNVLHNLGLNANILQDLRNDLSAVSNGSNPERALNNLMAGLQQLLASSNGGAKEWPAGKELPEGGRSFVKGDDGQPKEVFLAKEWPAGKELPEGGRSFVKGDDGQPKEVFPAKEWPAGKELPEGGKSFVKGNDGQPKEFDASQAQRRELENSNVTLQTSADAVISSLKELLGAQAAGGEISQPAANLRSALQLLLGDSSFANNSEQLRNALRNSINSPA
ncbi:hypothetical protein HX864_17605 [Pseudomonas yamanorum]|uniref:hypothetical protein n=1 Tax=Pseudomonas yamanorum TaxID=515393 RepID=UPI0015A3EC21|nr:hypothetical protein [Pseudomonas yamanorum]NWD25093.1 hypothetical protein [Pseudomonas yamanorum]